jgi:hypothetical protein
MEEEAKKTCRKTARVIQLPTNGENTRCLFIQIVVLCCFALQVVLCVERSKILKKRRENNAKMRREERRLSDYVDARDESSPMTRRQMDRGIEDSLYVLLLFLSIAGHLPLLQC